METRQKKQKVSDTDDTQASNSRTEETSPPIIVLQQVLNSQPRQLLKMILDHGIQDEDGDPNKLLENKEPLFRLKLDKNNSLERSIYVKANGKLLDQFVEHLTAKTGAKEAMPTFRIQLEEEYFQHENLESLLNCLDKCGAGLVGIEMDVPVNGGSLPGSLSIATLPILQELTMHFTGNPLGNSSRAMIDQYKIPTLFQSLLTGNKSLSKLVLTCTNWEKVYLFPELEYKFLPSSLTSIEIDFNGAEMTMEILTKNHLPNLKELTLGVSSAKQLSTSLLFQILENVRKTLRCFRLQGGNYAGAPRIPKLLRFPVMDELDTLEVQRVYFELEHAIPSIEVMFPSLKKLVLYDQTLGNLQKWMTGSPSASVELLALELVDESKSRFHKVGRTLEFNTMPFNLQAIQSAHNRFSDVRHLTVHLCGTEISCLSYIFRNMRQLNSLHIYVTGGASIVSSTDWDSLLIGASVRLFTPSQLATLHQLWNQLGIQNDQPSIRMLEELNSFSLKEARVPGVNADLSGNPLISNLAFGYAFLKMPQLISLSFKGRFKVSAEMSNEWKKTGRAIDWNE